MIGLSENSDIKELFVKTSDGHIIKYKLVEESYSEAELLEEKDFAQAKLSNKKLSAKKLKELTEKFNHSPDKDDLTHRLEEIDKILEAPKNVRE